MGKGDDETGCKINDGSKDSLWNPMRRVKYALGYQVVLSVVGMKEGETIPMDQQYVNRLASLVRNVPSKKWGKVFLLAMDQWYHENGEVDEVNTGLYVPNDYVFKVVEQHPDIFVAACSVHPYRKDAVQELERCYKRGARLIKWLPNTQGINPASPLCDAFYKKVVDLGMVLLSHTGVEHTIDVPGIDQSLGNPLLLRRALNNGVRVVAAHCGGMGKMKDLDDPKAPDVESLDLFLRIMDEKEYEELLFADISALTSWRRIWTPLFKMLNRTDLHHRLLNGSDYPLPALNLVVSTRALVKAGYITPEQRLLLNEIYDYNPLLFDFVTKRIIRTPQGNSFPASVFMKHPKLPIYGDEEEQDEGEKERDDEVGEGEKGKEKEGEEGEKEREK